jgi:FAD synthase
MEVDFLARLRDIRPFDSPEALINQLNKDIAHILRNCNPTPDT